MTKASRWHALYRREQFDPGLIGLLINPFFLARRQLQLAMRQLAPLLRGRLLDVGCGTKPYRALFTVDEYLGLDIDSETTRRQGTADVLYDGHAFPFEAGHFDAVLCNQVLEHVFNPDEFLAEICRVLAPGGKLLLTVPFVWDEHEQPWDYARYTSFGLRAILARHGMVVQSQHKLLADASVLFQLLNVYLYKVTRTRWPALNLLVNMGLLAPVSALGWLTGKLLPANADLYLDQIVVAEKTA